MDMHVGVWGGGCCCCFFLYISNKSILISAGIKNIHRATNKIDYISVHLSHITCNNEEKRLCLINGCNPELRIIPDFFLTGIEIQT